MKRGLSRRDVLKTSLAAGALTATSMVPGKVFASSKKVSWRMQTHWPPGVVYYKTIYEKFANRVREASNGEINISPLPPGTIVPTADVLQAVGRGLFQISLIWPAYWIGRIPVAGHLNGQMFTWNSYEEMWMVMQEMGALDIIREAYAEHGVHLVGPLTTGQLTLWSKKPLVKPEDFKGFKVRSTGVPAAVFQKMGATPVFFPGEELYQALQTGVCDGAHWGGSLGAWSMKFQEVTKYIIKPDLAQQSMGEVFINKKVWDGLSDHHKRILQDCCSAASIDANAFAMHQNYIHEKEFVEKLGGEIVNMDEETVDLMRKYSIEVINEYSEKDPKYSGRVGEIMLEFMRMTGKA